MELAFTFDEFSPSKHPHNQHPRRPCPTLQDHPDLKHLSTNGCWHQFKRQQESPNFPNLGHSEERNFSANSWTVTQHGCETAHVGCAGLLRSGRQLRCSNPSQGDTTFDLQWKVRCQLKRGADLYTQKFPPHPPSLIDQKRSALIGQSFAVPIG